MRLGAVLPAGPPKGQTIDPRFWARTSKELEDMGFESIWVFDGVGRGFMLPEPLTALSVVASATESVEIGTGVLQLPWRALADVAYRALTLHFISGGRFLFGIGPGSTERDFLAMGTSTNASYADRFRDFNAQSAQLVDILRTGQVNGIDLTPWTAAAGGPPVMVGAWRGPWVARAATDFDGWIASAGYNDDATLADALARFRHAGGKRAIVTNVQIGQESGPGIERLQGLAEIGFDDAVVFDLAFTPERAALIRAAVDRK